MSVSDVGKVWGQRIQKKMSFHVGDIACCGIQRLKDAIACIASARTLQNCHLIMEKDFKVILLGNVSYKSLVSVKNNKPTSLNQNVDN